MQCIFLAALHNAIKQPVCICMLPASIASTRLSINEIEQGGVSYCLFVGQKFVNRIPNPIHSQGV